MLNKFRNFILWLTIESVVIYVAWKYAVVPAFGVGPLLFGHIFLIWLAFKFLLWEFYMKLDNIAFFLSEIKDLTLFSEQNSANKFNAIADWLDRLALKYFSLQEKGERRKD